ELQLAAGVGDVEQLAHQRGRQLAAAQVDVRRLGALERRAIGVAALVIFQLGGQVDPEAGGTRQAAALEPVVAAGPGHAHAFVVRSEEHTSELQSRENLVCRLLLEKKKRRKQN